MILNPNLAIALLATVISFSTLYIPQPLLPMLAAEFSVSAGDAGLLMTVTMLPLGLAPVFYGYFLQAVPARLMLAVALFLLTLDQLAIYFVVEFWQLLLLRGIQGLLLPAIFTALMTYCASMVEPDKVRRAMGIYIGTTILGGFLGRITGGWFASGFDWHMPFLVTGFMLLLPLILLRYASSDAEISFQKLDRKSIGRVLKKRNYRYIYLILASVFFVYASILNLIPFRLVKIDPSLSPMVISSLYTGYLIGMPIAFYSQQLAKLLGRESTGLVLGLGLIAVALLCYLLPDFTLLFTMMFAFAGGFFFIHATLSGLTNQLATEHKGVVNGIYVSVYYLSGALASWLPVIAYEAFGWNLVIAMSLLLLVVSGLLIKGLNQIG